MSSEARLAPSDRSSTDKRASISLATRSLGGTLDMGLISSPVFSSANHFRGTRPFPFYRHSRTLPVQELQRENERLKKLLGEKELENAILKDLLEKGASH